MNKKTKRIHKFIIRRLREITDNRAQISTIEKFNKSLNGMKFTQKIEILEKLCEHGLKDITIRIESFVEFRKRNNLITDPELLLDLFLGEYPTEFEHDFRALFS